MRRTAAYYLFACAAILVASGAAVAAPVVDVPSQFSDSFKETLPELRTLAGFYSTTAGQLMGDLARLYEDDSALDGKLVALVANQSTGQFHFTNRGITISLPEGRLQVTRNSKAVNFEDACRDWPREGDLLSGTYENAAWRSVVSVRVRSHVPYIRTNGRSVAVRPGDSRTCLAENAAQTYYTGSLTIYYNGAIVKTSPVVGYTLQLP